MIAARRLLAFACLRCFQREPQALMTAAAEYPQSEFGVPVSGAVSAPHKATTRVICGWT